MTGTLQLTEQLNPTAQTFVVDESCVLTGIGIFFASVSADFPITLELRPTTDGGTPSSKRYIPGTRVTAGPGTDNSITGATQSTTLFYSSPPEFKFEFEEPVFVPANSLVSFVLYTSAPPGDYKIYTAKTLEFKYGKTTSYHTISTSEKGAFFASSNGTSWEPDNTKDVTFKAYKAKFDTNTVSTAILNANVPGFKALTETTVRDGLSSYSFDPLTFTGGSKYVKVKHPAHGLDSGDKVTLFSDGLGSFDSGDTINGMLGSSILGERTVFGVDPFGYRIYADSDADSSIRAGGTGLYATENHVINDAYLILPNQTPEQTNISVKGSFTTKSSFAPLASEPNSYTTVNNVRVNPFATQSYKQPFVVASAENQTLRLSGNPSTQLTVSMWTDNENVAPYFNVDAGQLATRQYLIDYQDSDNSLVAGRNYLTSTPYVSESQPDGGTNAAKHITVPYTMKYAASSIRVVLDAVRPNQADFTVWFRTANTEDDQTQLKDQSWTAFSKTAKNSKGTSYSDIAPSDDASAFREYEFDVFDLDDFNTYQIKITMNSRRMGVYPIIRNLRIVATS